MEKLFKRIKCLFRKKMPLRVSNYLRYLLAINNFKKDIKYLIHSHREKNGHREILLRTITEQYHAIEKGLVKINFRHGFGKNALNTLMTSLVDYNKKGYSKDNSRYITGLSVLNAYILRHESSDVNVEWIKSFLNSLVNVDYTDFGGVIKLRKAEILKKSLLNFEVMALSRGSVRDFSAEKIDKDTINNAIEIAMKTPSVCNRQGWFVRVIENKQLIDEVLKLQGGFKGHGDNIGYLILVTSLNNYFRLPSERYQGYIDGGLFSMSLIYSLTYKGLASCALNSNFSLTDRKTLNKLLDINESEGLIMFIAVGSYKDEVIFTKSHRDSSEEKIKYF